MTQPAKAQEPSMEEILASIRRIIADDDAKPETVQQSPRQEAAVRPPEPVAREAPRSRPTPPSPRPVPAPRPVEAVVPAPGPSKPAPAVSNSQDDIDAMLAGLDSEVASSAGAPAQDDDILELTEQMTLADPRKSFQTVEPSNDIEFAEPEIAPVEPPVVSKTIEEHVRARVMEDVATPMARPLMSQNTMASVDSAFNALAQTVLSNNARTLEDLVKEMLRPMLKGWLDDNLPGLVEKIVRAEIERVSRGR